MLLLLFVYLSLASFFGISFYRAYRYARMPMNGRWELYPVPGEGERFHYGGSYFEDPEWWKRTPNKSLAGELREMAQEMFFIKNLFINQRKLWLASYSMHAGIYVLGAWAMLMAAGAITEIAGRPVSPGGEGLAGVWAGFVYFMTIVTGAAGVLLVTAGSAGLLVKRVADCGMRRYTTPQEFLNLFFILAVAVSGLVVWAQYPGFQYGREIFKGLFTFTPIEAGPALAVHTILLGALLVYIPMTKMGHYIGKFFSFHIVLWSNEPNLRKSRMEERVRKALEYRPGGAWSAPHATSTGPAAKENS